MFIRILYTRFSSIGIPVYHIIEAPGKKDVLHNGKETYYK